MAPSPRDNLDSSPLVLVVVLALVVPSRASGARNLDNDEDEDDEDGDDSGAGLAPGWGATARGDPSLTPPGARRYNHRALPGSRGARQPVRILFSLDNYDHGTGGAEMSARGLARRLAARGHEVQVLQRGDAEASYSDGPIAVHTRPLPVARWLRDRERDTARWNQAWRGLLGDFLAKWRPHLVLTQNRLLPSSVALAIERGIPPVVFIRAWGLFCPTQFLARDALADCDRDCHRCLPWWKRLRLSRTRRTLAAYEQALRAARLVIANSRYTRAVLQRFYGIQSHVVYPIVDLAAYAAAGPEGEGAERDAVLFVKPQQVKGLPIFLEIARRMPDTRFLVAGALRGRARRRLRRLGNVECLGWVNDMRGVYARTRVLLGPSIWPEPFGRVFVEAAAAGVPAVASARGGIPEAVGDGGILIKDISDTGAWVDALRRLEDPATYAAYSRKAREHAARFTGEAIVAQFAAAVKTTLGLDL